MTANNIHKLREEASAFRVKPSEQVWEKLEQKLDNDAIHKKLRFYRLAAAALLSVCLTISILYIQEMNIEQVVALEASASNSRFYLEDLGAELETGIYEMERLRSLTSYYEKTGSFTKNLH
jgi:hypothetical protein